MLQKAHACLHRLLIAALAVSKLHCSVVYIDISSRCNFNLLLSVVPYKARSLNDLI